MNVALDLGVGAHELVELGGFAALTKVVSIESVAQAIAERFSGALAERNVAAARAAFDAAAA